MSEETKQVTLTTDEHGLFKVNSLEQQMQFAQVLLKTGAINQSFKTPQQVVIGIHFAIALGLDPRIALNSMYVINGRPALYGDGPLILVRRSGLLENFREYFVDEKGQEVGPGKGANVYAAVCEVKRKGEESIQRDWFSLDDRKAAGLNSPVWQKYERTMMKYRARSMALKSKFADTLNGIEIAEYITDSLPQEGIAEEKGKPKISNLNTLFTEEFAQEAPREEGQEVTEEVVEEAPKIKSAKEASFKLGE